MATSDNISAPIPPDTVLPNPSDQPADVAPVVAVEHS